MALGPAVRLGPYEIQSAIGAGGMGEVYKATDTRLDRTVAIKVLPEHVAADADLKQRFEREAKTLAALSHPHICSVFDVGRQDGIDFLVMEYLEGETLTQRLTKGALPLDHAFQIGIQIADALDKAHRKGIVHRDLKPGNIMLTKSGAKLLDFGLAKLQPVRMASGIAASGAPTLSSPLTGAGSIVGTFQFMAPEQLEGQEADARTDIFTFGAVLYEMVTGKKAFDGKSAANVIAAILERQPPAMSTFQPLTPPLLDHVVQRCLAKEPDNRWQSATDLRDELQWIAGAGAQSRLAASHATTGRAKERVAWMMAMFAVAAAVGYSVTQFVDVRPEPTSAIRFEMSAPADSRYPGGPAAPFPALSPDGRHIAFIVVQAGRNMLAIRALDTLQARVLKGTDNAFLPFWAPDSRFIGFFAEGKLKTIAVTGGPPQTLGDAPAGEGGSWNAEGTILFAPRANEGLARVSAAGGTATPVTTVDAAKEARHREPWFLPDGRRFLYVASSSAPASPTTAYVGSLDSTERVPLFASDSKVVYADGHLLFVREGTLLAQPFDAARLTITGEVFPLAEEVGVNSANARAAFAVSERVLAYRTRNVLPSQLVWVDRGGKQIGVLGDPALHRDIELSPDGKRVAVGIVDPATGTSDIWLYDVVRGLRTRFTFDPTTEDTPIWSPDGGRVLFRSDRTSRGRGDLYEKASNGAGSGRLLLESERNKFPDSWSSDGQLVLYETNDPKTLQDLWVLSLSGDQQPRLLLQADFNQTFGRFSPDGHWIAYVSNESGRSEVYVAPFPAAGGGKWLISTASGSHPRWGPDGKEVFYLDLPDDDQAMMMVAEVKGQGPGFEVAAVRSLFEARFVGPGYPYDVSPDGQRFLVSTPLEQTTPTPITVVVNWTAALKQQEQR